MAHSQEGPHDLGNLPDIHPVGVHRLVHCHRVAGQTCIVLIRADPLPHRNVREIQCASEVAEVVVLQFEWDLGHNLNDLDALRSEHHVREVRAVAADNHLCMAERVDHLEKTVWIRIDDRHGPPERLQGGGQLGFIRNRAGAIATGQEHNPVGLHSAWSRSCRRLKRMAEACEIVRHELDPRVQRPGAHVEEHLRRAEMVRLLERRLRGGEEHSVRDPEHGQDRGDHLVARVQEQAHRPALQLAQERGDGWQGSDHQVIDAVPDIVGEMQHRQAVLRHLQTAHSFLHARQVDVLADRLRALRRRVRAEHICRVLPLREQHPVLLPGTEVEARVL
mmetsp:Transcript_127590/g.369367  ORF Transcript_127590/g.369367 Transcript_127590/m.369367 type:complete len:334 (+) Transcript_127590:33-1034(+)